MDYKGGQWGRQQECIMGIRMKGIKNRVNIWLTKSLPVWLCMGALLSGGIVRAAESEKPGDYAMLTHPQEGSENYLKLTVPVGEHVVAEGESLWKIAQSVYEDGSRWQDLSALNELDNPDRIFPGQCLQMPDQEYYLQKPWIQRGKGWYMEDAGAYRFQTPEKWALGTCSLDARLSTFSGRDQEAQILWGVEDNEMGEDAWSENWEQVCDDMRQTAEAVFGENLCSLSFEKYQVESGNEVYGVRCIFTDQNKEQQVVSAAYRFGQKNLMEFIGFAPEDFAPDMSRLTLYTAATYEEYEEERHMGFGEKSGEYRGMEVWEYPSLHNPFVLAWEHANGSVWRLKKEPKQVADYVIDWKEPVLLAVVKEALQLEGDVRYSDLLQIESLEVVESAGYDFCSVNGERYETDWTAVGSGDALVEDISNFGGLYTLRIQIGDLTDLSSLEKLSVLEELEIFTGSQAKDLVIPAKLRSLKTCVLEKAPLQDYVDSLDDSIWERTCREQKITTFRKS